MTTNLSSQPPLIAGIGFTHLRVYEEGKGPDGAQSGCAHIHGVTDEAYFGIAGEGCLELHDPVEGFRSVPIHKGTYVQFPPGTLHRSVSHDSLEVLAVMGGGGLAERGDARIYFGAAVDEDPEEYQRLRNLAHSGMAGALQRRDASVTAYMALMELWREDRDRYRQELRRFVAVHRRELAGNRGALRSICEETSLHQAQVALRRVEALPEARCDAEPPVVIRQCDEVKLGMCGVLRQV